MNIKPIQKTSPIIKTQSLKTSSEYIAEAFKFQKYADRTYKSSIAMGILDLAVLVLKGKGKNELADLAVWVLTPLAAGSLLSAYFLKIKAMTSKIMADKLNPKAFGKHQGCDSCSLKKSCCH